MLFVELSLEVVCIYSNATNICNFRVLRLHLKFGKHVFSVAVPEAQNNLLLRVYTAKNT